MIRHLHQRVGLPLTVIAMVFGAVGPGQRVKRRAHGRRTRYIEHPVHGVHAVEHGVDLQPAPLEVFFRVALESLRIRRVTRVLAQHPQLRHRELPRVPDHLPFLQALAPVPQLLTQVAEERGRLITDLTRLQSL